jgi:RHS repeat-associated protein
MGTSTGSTAHWLLYDLLGSVVASQAAGSGTTSLVDALRYDAYGQTLGQHQATGSDLGVRFRGLIDLAPTADREVAGPGVDPLYQMGARAYAPHLGTFTKLDTYAGRAQDPISLNRYLYAHANPGTLIDPSGHAPCKSGKKCAQGSDRYVVVDGHDNATVYSGGQQVGSSSGGGGGGGTSSTGHPSAGGSVPPATPPAAWRPSGHPGQFACLDRIEDLTCAIGDFQRMSLQQRLVWINGFQAQYDQAGWINAIRGVVAAAQDSGLGASSWFGIVDARILHNIQEGFAAARTGRDVDLTSGTTEWTDFWAAVDERLVTDDGLNRMVADAEAASIMAGRADADRMGSDPTLGEAMALSASDTFRVAQRNRQVVKEVTRGICGMACVALDEVYGVDAPEIAIDAAVDERGYAVAYGGALSAFSANNLPGSELFPGWLFDALYR